MSKKGVIYLLPCPIGEGAPQDVLPAANFEVMRGLDYFIVENVRTARRFLSLAGIASQTGAISRNEVALNNGAASQTGATLQETGGAQAEAALQSGVSSGNGISQSGVSSRNGVSQNVTPGTKAFDDLQFVELNEHTPAAEVAEMLAPLLVGRNAGVISEAGVPAVADPGADIVAAAHRAGIQVVPLVGPSSILLALMASGMNGQSFAFNGYLPVKPPERARAIRHFERRALVERQSQIFIETPYRNGKLFADFLAICAPETRLCVAADISAPSESIRTLSVAEWRKSPAPNLDKRPTIFILG